ncbi:unnamed protein product [Amoebophrya sp. A25]|nr:unnamed protein product [Amoebophrya sp. A25]|eukprot:GSA25T00023468001.1
MSEATAFIAGFMVFGSLNTLSTKLQFSIESVGLSGQEHEFKKPFFGSYRMFFAMTLVLYSFMVFRFYRWLQTRAAGAKAKPLLVADSPGRDQSSSNFSSSNSWISILLDEGVTMKTSSLIAIPACCDLTSTSLSMIGLLHISASVWQMLRGSMVVFSGVLSVLFLKRTLLAYNWAGIGLVVAGIILVGTANMLAASAHTTTSTEVAQSTDDGSGRLFGMGIVLVGQFISAIQVVTEEFILKGSAAASLPPAVVVGIEGAWGFAILTLIGFPLLYVLPGNDYGGTQENLLDTFVMLKNSSSLLFLTFLYCITCSLYNFCGMSITRYLSAVHRTMLDAWRTMVVWLVGIVYYYAVDPTSDFGEPWTVYSYLQLLGFIVLIFGQLIYGGLLRLEALFAYPEESVANDEKGCKYEEFISPTAQMNNVMSPGTSVSVGVEGSASKGSCCACAGDKHCGSTV